MQVAVNTWSTRLPRCLLQVQLTGFTHTTLAVQGCAARTGASKGRWPHTSFSSTSTLMNTQSEYSSAILTNVGPMRWHGPHHVAVKSTHTSCGVEASQGRQVPALQIMLCLVAALAQHAGCAGILARHGGVGAQQHNEPVDARLSCKGAPAQAVRALCWWLRGTAGGAHLALCLCESLVELCLGRHLFHHALH